MTTRASRGSLSGIVTMSHGAGGKATAALVESLFLPALVPGGHPNALEDAAVLALPSGERVAFTTDAFVISPLQFPGGSIGDLAVNGTVNDLAVMGARPLWLSAAFVLEEGFEIASLLEIVDDMAAAAAAAGVAVVTGDTKVVERDAADGLYITTAGLGTVPSGRQLGASRVRTGDRVVVSGPIGAHGVAVLLARGDLELEADVRSDTAPLDGLVGVLLDAAPGTRWMRDPTRGGVATACNELVLGRDFGIVLDESRIPVDGVVGAACDLLGIDPLYVANEGRLLAVVPEPETDAAVDAMRGHPNGAATTVIGTVVDDPAGRVVLRTGLGGIRIVDMLVGDPLPRIC